MITPKPPTRGGPDGPGRAAGFTLEGGSAQCACNPCAEPEQRSVDRVQPGLSEPKPTFRAVDYEEFYRLKVNRRASVRAGLRQWPLWLGGECQWWMSSTPGEGSRSLAVPRTLSRVSINRLFSNWGRGQWLVATAVVLAIATVIVGVVGDLLAAAILQAVTLVFSVYGSYMLGQVSARQAAQELVRPHARSAFRRMQNLYAALGRLHEAVGQQLMRLSSLEGMDDKNFEHVRASLMLLEAVVIEQIATGEDAIEDWRDLVPDEVAEIERKARERGEDV